MADLGRVKEFVAGIKVPGIRELSARQNGSAVEIVGEADNLQAKQEVARLMIDQLGDRHGVLDLIRIPSDPGRGGQAEGVASSRSAPTSSNKR